MRLSRGQDGHGESGRAGDPDVGARQDELNQARRARALFGVTLAGILLYLALDAVAQSLPPHYSLLSQAESDLAVGPYGYVMTLNFISRGVLSLSFLFALALTANSTDTIGSRFRRGAWLFGVWSIGALLLAAFPTDVPPTPVSLHGAIHLVLAVLAFFGGAFGALYISLGMAGNRPLARASSVAVALAYLSLACLVVFLATIALAHLNAEYGGLVERVFLGSVLLWTGAVSFVMLTRPADAAS